MEIYFTSLLFSFLILGDPGLNVCAWEGILGGVMYFELNSLV